MNILHISSAATWRGGERQVYYLMEGLYAKGHSNFLMTPEVSILGYRTAEIVNSRITYKKGLFSTIRNVLALISFCDKNEITIIHGHDSHAHTIIWMAYKYGGLKAKSLVTRRLLNPIKRRSLGKYNYQKIEHIICISQAVKDVLSKSIINQNRLNVIYSGIDWDKDSEKIKKANTNENFIIGYVAAFTEEKDHSTFFNAAKYLLEEHPENKYKFVLVGDGPLIEKFKNESRRIHGDFHFLGFVEDVDNVYKDMDIILHTSKSEALGTAILDAQKHGLPAVVTNVGGLPEIIKNGENGFICNVGDYKCLAESVFKLASDMNLYNTLSKNTQVNLKQFEKTTMVTKTIALYQSVAIE